MYHSVTFVCSTTNVKEFEDFKNEHNIMSKKLNTVAFTRFLSICDNIKSVCSQFKNICLFVKHKECDFKDYLKRNCKYSTIADINNFNICDDKIENKFHALYDILKLLKDLNDSFQSIDCTLPVFWSRATNFKEMLKILVKRLDDNDEHKLDAFHSFSKDDHKNYEFLRE
ncbi:Hypothetical protein EIN_123140, partial [Entamoeba invadens IP1]